MNVAASGMRAADALLGVAAHNVANLNTGGYRPQRAELVQNAAAGGVSVAAVRSGADVGPELPEGLSGVDLATELVGATLAGVMYSANAAMFRTQAETTGALFSRRA